MATVTLFPTATEADGGTSQFTNPGNITATDGTAATFLLFAPTATSCAVRGKTFGFDSAIGVGATINTVTANFTYKVDQGTTGTNGATWFVRARVSGVDKTQHNSPSPRGAAGSPSYATFQSETADLTSDLSWTRSDLLDANFKLTFSAQFAGVQNTTFSLDSISVTVDYTGGAFNTKNTYFICPV